MPSLLQTLAPNPGRQLYDNWGWSTPGGIILDISETNPYRNAKDRLAQYRGWIYVVVSTIASDMAGLPVRIKNAAGDVVDDHPMLAFMRKPSPWHGPNVLKQTLQIHLDTAGEFFVYPERSSPGVGKPKRLHILSPDRVYIVPDPKNFIQGYLYVGWSGKTIAFEPNEIIHVRYANPMDPYRGMSPVQALGFVPRINEAMLAYIHGYLQNDARAGGVLTSDAKIDDKTAAMLRQRWEEAHASYSNAGRIAILSNGAKYQQTGSTVSDLNPKMLGEYGRDFVLATYNMPATKLGLTTNYNHSDAEAAENTYDDNCLAPRAVLWGQDFYQPLLEMFGPGYTAEVPNPSKGNREQVYKESLQDLQAGAITVRQHLEQIGSPYADEAPDVHLVPPGYTIMSALGDTPPPAQPPRELQAAIRSAAAAEYDDRKKGQHSRLVAIARWQSVLGSEAAALALERTIEQAITRDGLVATFERLKGPAAKSIARELVRRAG